MALKDIFDIDAEFADLKQEPATTATLATTESEHGFPAATSLLQAATRQGTDKTSTELLSQEDAAFWITRIKSAPTPEAVLTIVDEFCSGNWTDEQRATISRAYNAKLDRIGLPDFYS